MFLVNFLLGISAQPRGVGADSGPDPAYSPGKKFELGKF